MNNGGLGQRTPTDTLIHRLRLMADVGGVFSRDRKRTVIEAADRLEELDERVAIMEEGNKPSQWTHSTISGGDADEEH